MLCSVIKHLSKWREHSRSREKLHFFRALVTSLRALSQNKARFWLFYLLNKGRKQWLPCGDKRRNVCSCIARDNFLHVHDEYQCGLSCGLGYQQNQPPSALYPGVSNVICSRNGTWEGLALAQRTLGGVMRKNGTHALLRSVNLVLDPKSARTRLGTRQRLHFDSRAWTSCHFDSHLWTTRAPSRMWRSDLKQV